MVSFVALRILAILFIPAALCLQASPCSEVDEVDVAKVSLLQGLLVLNAGSPELDDIDVSSIGGEDIDLSANFLQEEVEVDASGSVVNENRESAHQSVSPSRLAAVIFPNGEYELLLETDDKDLVQVSLFQNTMTLNRGAKEFDDNDLNNLVDEDSIGGATFLQTDVSIDSLGKVSIDSLGHVVHETKESDSTSFSSSGSTAVIGSHGEYVAQLKIADADWDPVTLIQRTLVLHHGTAELDNSDWDTLGDEDSSNAATFLQAEVAVDSSGTAVHEDGEPVGPSSSSSRSAAVIESDGEYAAQLQIDDTDLAQVSLFQSTLALQTAADESNEVEAVSFLQMGTTLIEPVQETGCSVLEADLLDELEEDGHHLGLLQTNTELLDPEDDVWPAMSEDQLQDAVARVFAEELEGVSLLQLDIELTEPLAQANDPCDDEDDDGTCAMLNVEESLNVALFQVEAELEEEPQLGVEPIKSDVWPKMSDKDLKEKLVDMWADEYAGLMLFQSSAALNQQRA